MLSKYSDFSYQSNNWKFWSTIMSVRITARFSFTLSFILENFTFSIFEWILEKFIREEKEKTKVKERKRTKWESILSSLDHVHEISRFIDPHKQAWNNKWLHWIFKVTSYTCKSKQVQCAPALISIVSMGKYLFQNLRWTNKSSFQANLKV